jgi:hypothetical protein
MTSRLPKNRSGVPSSKQVPREIRSVRYPKDTPVPLAKKDEIYSLCRIPFLLTTE